MKNKILTIGIPTYNRANRLVETVKKIKELNSKEIEVLVLDNNSTDKTELKMKELLCDDQRINYIKNKENIGAIGNISKVLKASNGEYIYLMSDEDFVNLEFIEKILPVLKEKKYSLILGSLFDRISNSFYKKEKDKEYGSIFEIDNTNLHDIAYRGYMSGIILKKNEIKIDILYKYLSDTRHLYPHSLAIITLVKKFKVKIFSDIICYMQNDLGTEIIQSMNKKKIEYWEPIARIEQIKFWIEIINDFEMEFSLDERNKLLSSLAVRCSYMYYSDLFIDNYKNQREIYYNSILDLNEIKNEFLKNNKKLYFKIKFKRLLKLIISKKNIKKIKKILGVA